MPAQAFAQPIRKVRAGGVAGGVATLLVAVLQHFYPGRIDPATASALVAVTTYLVSYLVRPDPEDGELQP